MNALLDIEAERIRQVVSEGWTEEHDDAHVDGELGQAAACYADPEPEIETSLRGLPVPARWPWQREWWKPKDRRRDLVRAGALIVAEIERLDRAAMRAALKDKEDALASVVNWARDEQQKRERCEEQRAELRSRVAALEEALRPFALHFNDSKPGHPSGKYTLVQVEHLRAAAALLVEEPA